MLRLKSNTSVSPPRNIRQRSAVCARPLFLLFSRVSGEIFQCIVVSAPATLPLTPASHPQLFNFEVHTKVAAPPRAAAADEVTASRLLRFAFWSLAIAERRGERDLRLYLWEWAPTDRVAVATAQIYVLHGYHATGTLLSLTRVAGLTCPTCALLNLGIVLVALVTCFIQSIMINTSSTVSVFSHLKPSLV